MCVCVCAYVHVFSLLSLCNLQGLHAWRIIKAEREKKAVSVAREEVSGGWAELEHQSLCWEDPLEEGMATHSSILALRILWTEEPGGLRSMGL